MNFRSLVPFQNREIARPEAFLFGPLHREVDRLFDDFARSLTAFAPPGQLQGLATMMPKMDVTETDREIEITVEMPGLERKDVDITLDVYSKSFVVRDSSPNIKSSLVAFLLLCLNSCFLSLWC